MTKKCVLIDGIIYCQCGDQSSHYGTMGERGAREVRCEPSPTQVPSKEWNTPWRASGLAVYDVNGELVAHTGITGNRSMPGEQLERMATMIAKAVNAYSAGEPPAEPLCEWCGGTKDQHDDPSTFRPRAASPPVPEWQPIETAPNDETILVAYDDEHVEIKTAEDNDYQWQPYRGRVNWAVSPTHWMYPPTTPSLTKPGEQA